MNVDPNFAETLMSTFYAGGEMSPDDYKRCQEIWNAHNNNRSEVLKNVIELCGNINTPQTRYIRALAWSFNRVEFSEQRIESINMYLNNELYKKAYENSAAAINKGIKYGKKIHIVIMLKYLADAYCHLKMYDKEEETYLKIYNLKPVVPNGCISLAKYYSKRDQKKRAIELLEKEKKTLKYMLNKEYSEPIDKYLEELQKKQKGINKHVFVGYDTGPGLFYGSLDNPIFSVELDKKAIELRNKYKTLFDQHREFLEGIDLCESKINSNEEIEKYNELFNVYCLSDINIFPKIMNYYKEFNNLGAVNKIEYGDNKSSDYPVFRKLILFYEKEGKLEDAIKLCDIAIQYGITKYFGKMSMFEKKEHLCEKINDNKK